jgi:hypothetical protein
MLNLSFAKIKVFICPENQELTLDRAYPAPQEKGGGNKIKLVYSNYEACKKSNTKENAIKRTIEL